MPKGPGGQKSWVSPKKYQQALFCFQYFAIPSIFLKYKASSHNIEGHKLNYVKALEASSVRKAIFTNYGFIATKHKITYMKIVEFFLRLTKMKK